MFKFLKNLIPVSRKRYEKEKIVYLKDVKRIEELQDLIKRKNDIINDLSRVLDDRNIEINRKKVEIDRLEKQIEFSSDSLEKERERYSEILKTFVDFINKQEDQVKAVG